MNRDGSDPRSISAGLDREVYNATWAPDGSGLYALYDDEGMTKLALFGPGDDGTDHRVLTENVGGVGRAYAGATYTVAQDGSFAMNYTTLAVLSEIATGRPGSDIRVLTGINDDLFAKREIGEAEEIWYESSHDGRPIQGWIIKPPGFDPSRRYPLILEIHGGPFSNYGARFDLEKQLMAAQGYVVLYTNPRGSTSYGEEFGNLIHHAYPGDDFYDLMSGVDAVIDRGYADPDELNVVGGSGGGVLTAWLVGRTDRFRAAVSWYPVINWYSFVLTADMSASGVKYWFPGLPWDHVEHYESRSLLSVVENVTTPTRIVTGEEDWRTPMSESEQYFKALKLLGVETSLVRFPGEPHGIRRRPSHHIGKMLSTLEWFRRYSATTSLKTRGLGQESQRQARWTRESDHRTLGLLNIESREYDMQQSIPRPRLESAIRRGLSEAPVVALLGARQVGKTTLAEQVVSARNGPAVIFDLEVRAERAAPDRNAREAAPQH